MPVKIVLEALSSFKLICKCMTNYCKVFLHKQTDNRFPHYVCTLTHLPPHALRRSTALTNFLFVKLINLIGYLASLRTQELATLFWVGHLSHWFCEKGHLGTRCYQKLTMCFVLEVVSTSKLSKLSIILSRFRQISGRTHMGTSGVSLFVELIHWSAFVCSD